MAATRKSHSEEMARRMVAEMGGKIRRDNERRALIVTIGDTRQEFWQGSWPDVVVWLRKLRPGKGRKRGARA